MYDTVYVKHTSYKIINLVTGVICLVLCCFSFVCFLVLCCFVSGSVFCFALFLQGFVSDLFLFCFLLHFCSVLFLICFLFCFVFFVFFFVCVESSSWFLRVFFVLFVIWQLTNIIAECSCLERQ